MALAACRYTDSSLFFAERGDSIRDAIAVCNACPVQQTCLEYALTNFERFGVWGGKSERQRKTIRSARRKVAA